MEYQIRGTARRRHGDKETVKSMVTKEDHKRMRGQVSKGNGDRTEAQWKCPMSSCISMLWLGEKVGLRGRFMTQRE